MGDVTRASYSHGLKDPIQNCVQITELNNLKKVVGYIDQQHKNNTG